MKRLICLLLCGGVGVLSGCKTTSTNPKNNSVHKKSDLAMKELDAEIPKQKILFPEYFLLKDCTLGRHGRLPKNLIVAANIKTKRSIKPLLHEYNSVFSKNNWTIIKMEMGKKSFRFLAEKKEEKMEIRAVQGTTHVQIFILYTASLEKMLMEI
jgi:hypothetical protein